MLLIYGPKLQVRKRYFWEAWREQVWFVNLFNALFLRAQHIVGIEEPTLFARAVRNPHEPRFVQYLFSHEVRYSSTNVGNRAFLLMSGEEVNDPCLTQRYHYADERRCSEIINDLPSRDVFGFLLPSSLNPYWVYYTNTWVPSPLMQSPEIFAGYFFEEAECKTLYKPITTFYR
jgi:hypothetical protein